MGLLRYLLAASVVIGHSFGSAYNLNWVPLNGVKCVLLFFVISGFYMTLVLNEKYNSKQLILFWENRALRLWPSFIFATILMAIFAKPNLLITAFKETSFPTFLTIILSNFTMLGYEIKDITGLNINNNLVLLNFSETPISHYFYLQPGWSLGLEIWFYILAPFVVKSFFKTLIAFVLGLIFFISIKIIGAVEIWAYRSFPPVMTFFMLGSLSYHLILILKKYTFVKYYYFVGNRIILPFTIILLIFPNVLDIFILEQHKFKFFILVFFIFMPSWFYFSKKLNFDNIIGSASYPLYVIHPFIIFIFNNYSGYSNYALKPFVILILSTILSFIMVYLIENPIDKLRQRRVVLNKNHLDKKN